MRLTLQYKIALLITLIVAVILSSVYFYLNHTLTEFTYQRIRSDIIQKASLAEEYFEATVEERYTMETMDALADKISHSLGLRVTVINKDGIVLGDSSLNMEELKSLDNHLYRTEVQQALSGQMGESQRFSTTVRQKMLYIAFLVVPQTKPLNQYVLRLSIPLAEIDLVTGKLKQVLLISFGIAFLLSSIFSFFISRLISVPVKNLSRVAQAIAGGHFVQKANTGSRDEIGDLADSINYMSDQIKIRMEEVLSNKSKLEAVLLSMFEGVMVVDVEGRIILMNVSLKKILEVKEDPVGRRPLELIRNIDVQGLVDKALKTPRGVESRELHIHLAEEKIILVHATAVIRSGEIDGAILVFHDITELRRLEKIRQDFVANVSHELRTPVATIKGYAETLLDGALDDKENARDFLQIIHSDADRLSKLINDLLDLARIESGKLNLMLKPWPIIPIMERAVSLLRQQAVDKSVTILTDFPDKLPSVLVDENAIAQVLLNLIENAIKYTNDGGKIIVSAKDAGDHVLVSIKDNGIGIPQEDIPRIFERFYRVDKARSRQLGSTGLGLSIVKHILLAHNGDIHVESVVAKGSVFTFSIPKANSFNLQG